MAESFQESRDDYDDELDVLILDRPPARRSEADAARVLDLLDQLFGDGGDD